MLETILNLDTSLFEFINTTIGHPFLDRWMPFVTDLHKNPFFYGIVLPIIIGTWYFFEGRRALKILLGLALCIGATDIFNDRLLKPSFERARPHSDQVQVVQRGEHKGGYSFPSNHAANNFAGATFLSLIYPFYTPILFGIALIVGFSRIYLGVHYPFDVFGGALVGMFFGLVFFLIWNYGFKLHKKRPT